MTYVAIDRAASDIADLIRRAQAGEDIVIVSDGTLLARLVPIVNGQQPRRPGDMKGQLDLPNEFFFDALPDDELRAWSGDSTGPK